MDTINHGHPDKIASIEWFGIVDIDRRPRKVYMTLKGAFSQSHVPPPPDYPLVVDFSRLPMRLETILTAFPVTGHVETGSTASVNGQELPADLIDSQGYYLVIVPLAVGNNSIELKTRSTFGVENRITRNVVRNPALSLANRHLLYVDSSHETPDHPAGTFVIDLDNNVFLGVIEGSHIRGTPPSGNATYM